MYSKVKLFIERLKGDWDRQPVGMKQPWLTKTALPVHASCGGFLAIMAALKASVPQADYESTEKHVRDQFQIGFLDGDINLFLESTVPPVNLQQVNFVRTSQGVFFSFCIMCPASCILPCFL